MGRIQWQPTPVFLPGESQGQGSLVGCRLWGLAQSRIRLKWLSSSSSRLEWNLKCFQRQNKTNLHVLLHPPPCKDQRTFSGQTAQPHSNLNWEGPYLLFQRTNGLTMLLKQLPFFSAAVSKVVTSSHSSFIWKANLSSYVSIYCTRHPFCWMHRQAELKPAIVRGHQDN